MTVPGVLPELVKVCETELPEPLAKPPMLTDDAAAVQLKVVEPTFELNEMAVFCPLQMLGAELVGVTTGSGLTVTVMQLLDHANPPQSGEPVGSTCTWYEVVVARPAGGS